MTVPPRAFARAQAAWMSFTWTYTTPLYPLTFPSAARRVPIAVPPATMSKNRPELSGALNYQPKSSP